MKAIQCDAVQRAGFMPHRQRPSINAAKRNALVNDQRLFGFSVIGQSDDFIHTTFVVFPALAGHGVMDGMIHKINKNEG